MLGAIIYLTTTEFALNQGISPIFQMQHNISFQVVSVMVVRYMAV